MVLSNSYRSILTAVGYSVEKLWRIGIVMALLILGGLYFLCNQDNPLSRNLVENRHPDYSIQKVSKHLGFNLIGIAVCALPALLAVVYGKLWVAWLSPVLFAIQVYFFHRYEKQGKLKK